MTVRILTGDVRERLADLPDASVQCVVTSPPYFGLRDYGTAQWDGGDAACDHTPDVQPRHERGNPGGSRIGNGGAYNDQQDAGAKAYRDQCRKCGAVRIDAQIGLEPTLAEYVATLVAVFREVRRVLRDDGTVWLNLGDSYAGSWGNQGRKEERGTQRPINTEVLERPWDNMPNREHSTGTIRDAGLKPKDLMMVPARVALALQDDGWWLRSDIIWAKKNCMPESVTDRPTSSHEHIFLLTKSARYFYDAEAVREGNSDTSHMGGSCGVLEPKKTRLVGNGHSGLKVDDNTWVGRNQRNVWHLATEPFPDAHFATFPSEIPRRCIKAGTSEKGACAACGAPWVRVVERDNPRLSDEYDAMPHTPKMTNPLNGRNDYGAKTGLAKPGWRELPTATSATTGWQPSCSCNAGVVPQTVLDPFLGSGTTLLVADQLGRDGIGIELNPEYARMAENRIRNDAPMFAEVVSG